jgi:hypothetical protein
VATGPGGPPTPRETEFDIDDVEPHPQLQERHLWQQELVRSSLALSLTAILALTIIGAFIGALGSNWTNVKELLQLILPAETALLGGAAGFYFGSRQQN